MAAKLSNAISEIKITYHCERSEIKPPVLREKRRQNNLSLRAKRSNLLVFTQISPA